MTSKAVERYEDKKSDLVVKDFLGVNTQAGRTAIAENEFAWLENVMPVGYANLKAVPYQGAADATIAAVTINYMKYVNLNGVDYQICFTTSGSGHAVNLSTFAVTTIGASATFTGAVACAQWKNERVLIVDAGNYYSWDGTTLTKNGSVQAVNVTAAGAAYTAIPSITFSGGGGVGAAASAAMKLVGAQTISAAGAGYTVGDILTLAGGTNTVAAKLRVDTIGGGGTVTAISIYQAGSYTVLPAAPNTVTGGTGAGCTITHAWGVSSIAVTNGGTTPYNSAPTVAFSSGAAAATAVIILGPSGGSSIGTFAGRVWVGLARTVTFSAPDSFVDFTTANAGGSFIVTDETLHSNINALLPANNFLYIVGDSSFNVLSDVRVVAGTPPVTLFSNTNVTALIGSTLPLSIFPFYRTVAFATVYGFYALVGATPQKMSDHLDGIIPLIDFTKPVSGDVANIFNILCMCFCFTYNDPAGARPLLALFFNKKWFFASQGSGLTLVSGGFQSGKPAIFGTDGTNIWKLFKDTTSDIATKIVTPLWPMKAPTRTKEVLKAGVEITTTAVATGVTVSVDSDFGTVPTTLSSTNTGQWINAAMVLGNWINNALTQGQWLASGFQIYQGNIDAFGRYVGYTLTATAPGYAVNGLLMQYEQKANWATKG